MVRYQNHTCFPHDQDCKAPSTCISQVALTPVQNVGGTLRMAIELGQAECSAA